MGRETVRERKERLERGGAWLRQRRLDREWTGVELARRLGLPQAKLSAYENGRYEVDVSVARTIATVLGLTELQVWRGLELPLPRELDPKQMSDAEVVAYVESRWPGRIAEILGGVPPEKPPVARNQERADPDTQGQSGDSERTA